MLNVNVDKATQSKQPNSPGNRLGPHAFNNSRGLKLLQNAKELIPIVKTVRNSKATLGFLLTVAYQELFQRELYNAFSFQGSWFYWDCSTYENITDEKIEALTKLINNWLSDDTKNTTTMPRNEVKVHFATRPDKLGLIKLWLADPLPIVRFGHYFDFIFSGVETDKKKLRDRWCLMKYERGILLRFSDQIRHDIPKMLPFVDLVPFFQSLSRQEQWANDLQVNTINDLNSKVFNREILELLYVSEAFHEKMFSHVADILSNGYPQRRVVCIAGPSASGKTTSAWRLKIALRANGFNTILIGMDTFYKDEKNVPRTKEGRTDYDCYESIHQDLLVSRINDLLEGKSVPLRKFHFPTHTGWDTETLLTLPQKSFIIVEGIHGFNPLFTKQIGEDKIYKCFVSAFTPINIDNNNHMRASDVRLLRRILRDHETRGFPADDTLTRWPDVRRNEEMYIFPYQQYADYYINTTLAYELPVLANYCKPLLAEVTNSDAISEAERLLKLLSLIYPVNDDYIPPNSILCEFLNKPPFPDHDL